MAGELYSFSPTPSRSITPPEEGGQRTIFWQAPTDGRTRRRGARPPQQRKSERIAESVPRKLVNWRLVTPVAHDKKLKKGYVLEEIIDANSPDRERTYPTLSSPAPPPAGDSLRLPAN